MAETELGETGGGRLSIPVVPWQAKALETAALVASLTLAVSTVFQLAAYQWVSLSLSILLMAVAQAWRLRAAKNRIQIDVDFIEFWKGDLLQWQTGWADVRSASIRPWGIAVRDRTGRQFTLPRARLLEVALRDLSRSDAVIKEAEPPWAFVPLGFGFACSFAAWTVGLQFASQSGFRAAMLTAIGGACMAITGFFLGQGSYAPDGKRHRLSMGQVVLLARVLDDRPRVFRHQPEMAVRASMKSFFAAVLALSMLGAFIVVVGSAMGQPKTLMISGFLLAISPIVFIVVLLSMLILQKQRGSHLVLIRGELCHVQQDRQLVRGIPWGSQWSWKNPILLTQYFEAGELEAQKVLDELGWLKALEPKQGELEND